MDYKTALEKVARIALPVALGWLGGIAALLMPTHFQAFCSGALL